MTNLDPERAHDLEEAISTILAGEHPGVQGATLASLVACWLAAQRSPAREPLIEAHVRAVRKLIPLYEGLIQNGGRRRSRALRHH